MRSDNKPDFFEIIAPLKRKNRDLMGDRGFFSNRTRVASISCIPERACFTLDVLSIVQNYGG